MEILSYFNNIIAVVFALCYVHQFFYVPLVILLRKRRAARDAEELKAYEGRRSNRYAILVCARDEQAVIGDLIDSIGQQTYPQDHIRIFVMADNCSDDTAEVAREKGAVVYERTNDSKIGKGYALEELLSAIHRDCPGEFDGFFVFDADNLLEPDYIEKMDLTFSGGKDVITSYRNTKNYGANWVSKGYAVWFLRESRYLNNARHLLNISCTVSGTGYLFSERLYQEIGGWPFHSLTEDLEFSTYLITRGEKVAFCPDAMFYDEQPVSFVQSLKQRLRWARGFIQVIHRYGGKLIKGIFKGNFSCYDLLMNIGPGFFLSSLSIIANVVLVIVGLIRMEDPMIALRSIAGLMANAYMMTFAVGLITVITEWRLIRATVWQKIWSAVVFPFFLITYIPLAIVAAVHNPGWEPIEHTYSVAKMSVDAKKTSR